jgi:uncharacterized protein YigE (DUF2233 family)
MFNLPFPLQPHRRTKESAPKTRKQDSGSRLFQYHKALLTAIALGLGMSMSASAQERDDCAGAISKSIRCVIYSGHTYAVAELDLRNASLVAGFVHNFADDAEIYSTLRSQAVDPFLITNGGIYGVDRKPLGLLINNGRVLHSLNLHKGAGNFSWKSSVFSVKRDGIAAILDAGHWHDSGDVEVAVQSGPLLVAHSIVNADFSPKSHFVATRTAVGVKDDDRRRIVFVISTDAVTLHELATFLATRLHCESALHLDGNISVIFEPGTQTRFGNSEEVLVTYLAAVNRQQGDRAVAH